MADLDLFGAFDGGMGDIADLVSESSSGKKRKAALNSSDGIGGTGEGAPETGPAAKQARPEASAPEANTEDEGKHAGEGSAEGAGTSEGAAPFVVGGVSKVFTVTAYDETNGNRKACRHEVAIPPGMDAPDVATLTGSTASVSAKVYPFELDPFQKAAIGCLDRNQSVLVSAHTSAGKTVVAE